MDSEMEMTECDLFKILSIWVEGDPSLRKDAGLHLSNHISFEKINPQFLATTVASSGLVCSEQLLEAYKNQALALEKLAPANVQKCRKKRWVSEKPLGAGIPCAIKVDGAGKEDVNGVYTQDGSLAGKPKYTKEGSYGGKQREFWLSFNNEPAKFWYIGMPVSANSDLGFGMIFYDAYTLENLECAPPAGWNSMFGEDPPPNLLYMFED